MCFATRGFWSLSTRGGLAIAMGVSLAAGAGARAATLSSTFGAFALAMSAVAVASSLLESEADAFGWALLLEGVAGLGLGAIALAAHGRSWLGGAIAAWAFVVGIFELAVASELRARVEPERLLASAGALSLGCAAAVAALTATPSSDGLDGARLVCAAWAVAFGGLLLASAFRLREVAAERASFRALER